MKKICDTRKGRQGSHDGFMWSLRAIAQVKMAKAATQFSCQPIPCPSYPCYFDQVGELA
jgi:hypothetical protein